jgi:type I restriction enzyme S subunit
MIFSEDSRVKIPCILHLLEQENQQLAKLRDWLLPLLMNGQVTVA